MPPGPRRQDDHLGHRVQLLPSALRFDRLRAPEDLGSLEAGKLADLVVLARDRSRTFTIPTRFATS